MERLGRHSAKYQRLVEEIRTDSLTATHDLARREIGEARVNCCFRASRARWGKCQADDVAILFLEISTHEPVGFKFKQFILKLKFSEKEPFKHSEAFESSNAELYLMNQAPTEVRGDPVVREVTQGFTLDPSIEAAGVAASFGSLSSSRVMPESKSWIFRSNMDSDTSGKFTTAVWIWEANTFTSQVDSRGILHAALVLRHPMQPFYISCDVSGTLCKKFRIANLFQRRKQSQGPHPPKMMRPVAKDDDLQSAIENLETEVQALY